MAEISYRRHRFPPGGNHCGMADDGDCVTLPPSLNTQHAKAVLGVVESHSVD